MRRLPFLCGAPNERGCRDYRPPPHTARGRPSDCLDSKLGKRSGKLTYRRPHPRDEHDGQQGGGWQRAHGGNVGRVVRAVIIAATPPGVKPAGLAPPLASAIRRAVALFLCLLVRPYPRTRVHAPARQGQRRARPPNGKEKQLGRQAGSSWRIIWQNSSNHLAEACSSSAFAARGLSGGQPPAASS